MKPKLLFPIETVIEGNLGLQTVNRTLQNDYKIYNPNVKLFTTEKFISSFNNWPNNKKENFIKLVAGKANFRKGLAYFNSLGANYGN
jgi:hypothetical protein